MCVCGDDRIEVECVVEYDDESAFWRGVVVRVFDVDDDGGDVAVRYIWSGVVVCGTVHRHASVCGCACV